MSYKFDMSEYEKPLKQEASDNDADMSISTAKENALKNLEIAEKFIKKVSTKATEEQKRFIEERIAGAKREIIEAAKGLDPRNDNPYSLPTKKDLGQDKTEESIRHEKANSFKTIHFIRRDSPAIGSAEADNDRFDLSIPTDALRRIQEAEQRVLRDVEAIVKGNEQSQEVVKTIYVENEADPLLRAQVTELYYKNVDLQAEVARLNGEIARLDGEIADPGGLTDQITAHLDTIAANDAEILRLSRLLYGDLTDLGPADNYPYDLFNPRNPRPNRDINPNGAPGPEPTSLLKTNRGYVGDLDALEAKRRADVAALQNIINDATPDPALVIPAVNPPAAGGVPGFAGAPGGLPRGLQDRVNALQQMVLDLSSMIETPEVLAAQNNAVITNNAARAAYDVRVTAYDADVARFNQDTATEAKFVEYNEYINYENWRRYEDAKFLNDEERHLHQIVSDLVEVAQAPAAPAILPVGVTAQQAAQDANRAARALVAGKISLVGIPSIAAIAANANVITVRRAAKSVLKANDGSSPWAQYVQFITARKQPPDANPNIDHTAINDSRRAGIDPIVQQIDAYMRGHAPAVAPRAPAPPRPALYGGLPVAPGVMPAVAAVIDPASPAGGNLVRPNAGGGVVPVAGTDPRTNPLVEVIDIGPGPGQIPAQPADGNAFTAAWPRIMPVPPVILGGFRAQLNKMTAAKELLERMRDGDVAAATQAERNGWIREIERLKRMITNVANNPVLDAVNTPGAQTVIPAAGVAPPGLLEQLNDLQNQLALTTADRDRLNTLINGDPTAAPGRIRDGLNLTIAQLDATINGNNTAVAIGNVPPGTPGLLQDLANMTANRDRLQGLLTTEQSNLAAANQTITQLQAGAAAINNAIVAVNIAGKPAANLKEITDRLAELEASEQKTKDAITSFQQLNPDVKFNITGKNEADINAISVAVQDIIANMSNLRSENNKLTRQLKRATDELNEKNAELNNLTAKLNQIGIMWDHTNLSGPGYTGLRLAKRQADQSARSSAIDSMVLPSKRLAGQLAADVAALADFEQKELMQQELDFKSMQEFQAASGKTLEIKPSDRLRQYRLNTLQRGAVEDVVEAATFFNGMQPIQKKALLRYLNNVGLPQDSSRIGAYMRALINWFKGGKIGLAPNINDYGGAIPPGGVTGGGYFDGGEDDPFMPRNKYRYPLKRGGISGDRVLGGDDNDSEVDVMLTAGVGGAVGSVMWLGWGGLVIFLLLLFIYYLSNNIYNNMCEKPREMSADGVRKYHREIHRRK